ncbi:MAG TPA: efflux RND transporter periplasmic adaptor subunit [Nevskiaceae bacterium]|nr:efflux RND transporter periplasmic adaptor subunit [Nevskiaceae bacterium]
MGKYFALIGAALLAACSSEKSGSWLGYVEGESVHVAAPVAGQLASLQAQRGQEISQGQPLFALEQEREKAAVDEGEHRLNQAQSQLDLAQRDLKRQEDMRKQGLSSIQQLDMARTQTETTRARVEEIQAQLDQSRWVLSQKTVTAPAVGVVEDVYYRIGEQVAAGAPVLSLLPPQNRKLRFFVPQAELERVKVGTSVSVHCDGCASDFAATVRFIAPQAEYTPPVIYSDSARQKLVFLVEAWPGESDAGKLKPGQPVEVRLPK